MRIGSARRIEGWLLALALCVVLIVPASAHASEHRRTAIVEAVERARSAIVNIHGEKTIEPDNRSGDAKRRVNGMGTGIILDERGYIITNHHVVDGVRKIVVTTAQRETYVARLVSHDPKTDLAVIKVDSDHEFNTIDIGTSSDLMTGETVIAVGNAYGYEHTVTRGIISSLHRTVQVSETQHYDDLIQTDASINPGNSGGPLLNIDGEMIGINVAVRAGAQGIGFAIPVDIVLNVAGELMSVRRLEKKWHGLNLASGAVGKAVGVLVKGIDEKGPAASSGLRNGDIIKSIAQRTVTRPLDIERALLGQPSGEAVDIEVQRQQQTLTLPLTLAAYGSTVEKEEKSHDLVWDVLGLKLEAASSAKFAQYRSAYRGGLTVLDVRPDSPAAKQGIRRGDTLVGMHVYETVSLDNVSYVMGRPDFAREPIKFYILRGSETLYGYLTVASKPSR